jgi:hypothetical protein
MPYPDADRIYWVNEHAGAAPDARLAPEEGSKAPLFHPRCARAHVTLVIVVLDLTLEIACYIGNETRDTIHGIARHF